MTDHTHPTASRKVLVAVGGQGIDAETVRLACRMTDPQGGRLYGGQPSLSDLDTDRNLKFTTDFRSVLSEVLSGHLGSKNLQIVFPGFDNSPARFPHLLKA